MSESHFQTRPFGRTGASLPCLGLGCQRLVDTSNCTANGAQRILETAYELGIRYFDTAWVYGLGQAEERLGRLARTQRSSIWLATKTTERTEDGALRQLEESLTRLQTDHVDEWRLHNGTQRRPKTSHGHCVPRLRGNRPIDSKGPAPCVDSPHS